MAKHKKVVWGVVSYLFISIKKTRPYVFFIDMTLQVDTIYNRNDDRYHLYANINFKVLLFDSQLNYVLHRDKASEHNNHAIRQR